LYHVFRVLGEKLLLDCFAVDDPAGLDVVGDPALREVLRFVRSRQAPSSADDVAVALHVHRSVARGRLERLLAGRAVRSGYERRTGRSGPGAGRPTKVYSAAVEREAIEFPDRHYEELVEALAGELEPAERDTRLERAGERFGAALARAGAVQRVETMPEAADEVCAALGRLGFQASPEHADESEATVRTPTCPLRPLVCRSESAGEIDRGLWNGLFGAALGRPVSGACEAHGCLEAETPCTVRVRLGSSRGAAGRRALNREHETRRRSDGHNRASDGS
jgi:predicted ArsR family transcriptional regulator